MSGPLPPITLEVTVLLLGISLLFAECFAKGTKDWMVKLSIFVLTIVFAWSFHTTGTAGVDLSKALYAADSLALFFKRIALLTTIVVLIMSIEFKSTIAKYVPAERPEAGLGEFYALPILTCAGLMFMASAVDFV